MENLIIYDWISFTSKISSPESIIDLLGLDKSTWQEVPGNRGYKSKIICNEISIHYDGTNEGVWVELSGQGCRYFESFGNGDYDTIFNFILSNPDETNISRLDIAYDDHLQYMEMDKIISDTLKHNYISKSTEWQVIQSSKGQSVYIGSHTSDTLINIYDKAAERGYDSEKKWVRCEIRLSDDRALRFIELDGSIGVKYCGVLHNYLRFGNPSDDSNKSRWTTRNYWKKVLDNVNKISVYVKPGTEYNIHNCEHYVYKQAGNAVETLIKIKGVEKFFEELKETPRQKNPKYNKIVQDHENLKKQINITQPLKNENPNIDKLHDKIESNINKMKDINYEKLKAENVHT